MFRFFALGLFVFFVIGISESATVVVRIKDNDGMVWRAGKPLMLKHTTGSASVASATDNKWSGRLVLDGVIPEGYYSLKRSGSSTYTAIGDRFFGCVIGGPPGYVFIITDVESGEAVAAIRVDATVADATALPEKGADLNSDGTVNSLDLLRFVESWRSTREPAGVEHGTQPLEDSFAPTFGTLIRRADR